MKNEIEELLAAGWRWVRITETLSKLLPPGVTAANYWSVKPNTENPDALRLGMPGLRA